LGVTNVVFLWLVIGVYHFGPAEFSKEMDCINAAMITANGLLVDTARPFEIECITKAHHRIFHIERKWEEVQ
jgi:hypothetical protein